MTLFVYLGILALGLIGIVLVLRSENNNRGISPIDLLNKMDFDERSVKAQKTAREPQNLSFRDRIGLDNERIKESDQPGGPLAETSRPALEPAKPSEKPKTDLARSAQEFEKRLKFPEKPSQPPQDPPFEPFKKDPQT